VHVSLVFYLFAKHIRKKQKDNEEIKFKLISTWVRLKWPYSLVCRAFSEMVNIRDILGWPLSRVSFSLCMMMMNLWVAYCAYAALFYEVVIAMLEKRSQLVSRYLHVKRVLILNYCDTSTSSAPLFPSYLFIPRFHQLERIIYDLYAFYVIL